MDQARAAVGEARAAIAEFDGAQPHPGPVPAGKTIAVIIPVQAPLPTRAAESVQAAAETIGWTARVIDGRGTPQGFVNALDQAISSGVDGIVLAAMPIGLLQEGVTKAAEAGIAVTAILPNLPDLDDADQSGVFAWATPDEERQGYLLGQWVIQDAPAGAKAIVLTSPEFVDLSRASAGFQDAFADAGESFEVVEVVESPVQDVQGGPQGVQRLAALMRKHADAQYMFVLSESWFNIFLQAKELTGRTDITGLGTDGDFSVPLIEQGEELVIIGPDTLTYGWYAVDGLIRAFNGEEPVRYVLDGQLVDATNAGDIDDEGITASYDYRSEWLELWGVED